jgi:hypothetical protein
MADPRSGGDERGLESGARRGKVGQAVAAPDDLQDVAEDLVRDAFCAQG